MEIYVCNVDGSDMQKITDLGGANWAPYFHPSNEKIIFSSNHASERGYQFNLYMINIDGTGLTQLTDGTYNNLDPCWLPDGGIAFISDRKPAYAYCYVVTSPVLYRMDSDGSNQKRLSANYLMDFTPSVLEDGRIIYTRWEYVDRPACPIQSLWAINPDGTGLAGFYGNRVLSPGTFMDAQPVPGTNRIVATAILQAIAEEMIGGISTPINIQRAFINQITRIWGSQRKDWTGIIFGTGFGRREENWGLEPIC